MTRTFLTATALAALCFAVTARAEQFVVRLDAPMTATSAGLRETLKVREIDAFSLDGGWYVVIDAPDEAYVETYLRAAGRSARALNTLNADWAAPGLAGLPLEQRLPFLAPAPCGFCAG